MIILNRMVRMLNKLFKHFGFQIIKYKGRDIYNDVNNLLKKNHEYLLIDAGAYIGDFSSKMLTMNKNISALAFEPNILCEKKLMNIKNKYGDRFNYELKAIGEKQAETKYYRNTSPLTNSLLETSMEGFRYFVNTNQNENISLVQMVTIDDICNYYPKIDKIIKMDLQGYECNALYGAKETLHSTRIIIIEMNYFKYYKNGSLYYEVDQLLRESGFFLYNIYDIALELKSRRMLFGDCIYLNKKYYEQ